MPGSPRRTPGPGSRGQEFIYRLKLRQFLARGEVVFLFENLPNLNIVSITYGSRNVGMDYDRSSFGMKLADCEAMARAFVVSPSLTTLVLNENLLDDEKVRRLVVGLRSNETITDVGERQGGTSAAHAVQTCLIT